MTKQIEQIFTREVLLEMFPKTKTNDFFEALFGDAEEGAFDIELNYRGCNESNLDLELLLHERPGHCLACNLTQGLPQVFSRHPVIDIKGLVAKINTLLGDTTSCTDWKLGYTEQRSRQLHVVPLHIDLQVQ